MTPKSTKHIKFSLRIVGIPVDAAVLSFHAVENISTPFEVTITFACEEELSPANVLSKDALLTVHGEEERYFHGIVNKAIHTGNKCRMQLYEVHLAPDIWSLTLKSGNRIFQDKKTQEIVERVLIKAGISIDRFSFRLQHPELMRKYCVQYQETDFAFVSRLLEEEGIIYFFEHSRDKHLLVFADGPIEYQQLGGNRQLPFQVPSELLPERGGIDRFSFSRCLCPESFMQRAFSYEHPSFDYACREGDTDAYAGVYEAKSNCLDSTRGNRLARSRLEELTARQESGEGSSSCARLSPGYTFQLTGHPCQSFNQEYLLLKVNHTGEQPQAAEEQSGGAFSYCNTFEVIPASISFRPPRLTPRPVVKGMQTAIVVGPQGEEIYTDRYGRVKVQFHWDRSGQYDERSSCWLRVAQGWGGAGSGMLFTPRVGSEVLVDFLDGNPDRPIIVGSAYNEKDQPPYELPRNGSVSTIKTRSSPNGGGSNELRFEDSREREEIYLQGQRDWNVEVGNDKRQSVGRNESHRVGRDRLKYVAADQEVKVGGTDSESIGADKRVTVSGCQEETVALNAAETIGAAKELTVGGLYQTTVGGALNETVAGAKTEEVGAGKAVRVGAAMTETVDDERGITAGKNLTILVEGDYSSTANSIGLDGADEVVFRTGKAMLSMKATGELVLQGGNVAVNGSREVRMRGGRVAKSVSTDISIGDGQPEKQNYSQRFDFSEMHAAGNHSGMDFAGMPVVITRPDGTYITTVWTDENGVTNRFFTEKQEEIVAWAGKGDWDIVQEFEYIEDKKEEE